MRARFFVGLISLLVAPSLAWGQVVIPGTGGTTVVAVAGNRTTVVPKLCTGTDKVSGIATGGTVNCATDVGGSVAAEYLVLTLDGTLTAERNFTSGIGIGFTDGGANAAYNIFYDSSELTANQTFWSGASATRTITYSLSGATDPVFNFGNNLFNVTNANMQEGGVNLTKTVSFTSTNCAEFDVNGDVVDSGAGCGGGSGDNITVNGAGTTNVDLDDADPAAPSEQINIKWQLNTATTPDSVSAYVPILAVADGVGVVASDSGFEPAGASSDLLALLQGCADGEILKWDNTATDWECQPDNDSGGSPTLDSIIAAAGTASINSGDNAIVWNWSLTTADKVAFKITENVASVATGNPVLFNLATLAASTAHPFEATARGTANGVRVGATDGIIVALGTGGLDWPALLNYPSGCTNQFVRTIADTPTCNTVGTSDIAGNAADNTIIRDSAGFSVIGKSTTGTGDPADIVATDETVLGRTAAGNLGFAQLATGQVANDAITFPKMQNIATDRLLGRDTAATGDPEELTVGGGVEFTGSGGIQRSALTGDVTATAGSNTTAIAAGAVASAELATANKTFKCNFTLFDSTGLLDADDIPSISNCTRPGRAITITEIWAETDAGTPSINLQRDDGTPANICTANLTPTTGGATCTIAAAEDNFAATDRLDFVMVLASTATRINVAVEYTVD